jgi:HK97 gp10 family phage protein
MASFEVEIDSEFIKEITRLGDRSEVITRLMLDDAGQILADTLEAEIRLKHKASGELADSIVVQEYQDKRGNWVAFAHPEGRSKKLMRQGKVYKRSKSGTKTSGKALYNADKLFWIEMGTSRQPAQPFIERMCRAVEGKIMANMQAIFDREVGGK